MQERPFHFHGKRRFVTGAAGLFQDAVADSSWSNYGDVMIDTIDAHEAW